MFPDAVLDEVEEGLPFHAAVKYGELDELKD